MKTEKLQHIICIIYFYFASRSVVVARVHWVRLLSFFVTNNGSTQRAMRCEVIKQVDGQRRQCHLEVRNVVRGREIELQISSKPVRSLTSTTPSLYTILCLSTIGENGCFKFSTNLNFIGIDVAKYFLKRTITAFVY